MRLKYIHAMREDYFIGVDGRELERLKDQHAAWKPETEALWNVAGFHTGQHLADLGSGPGFSAIDLARIVGSSGKVTALDKAAPYLDFLKQEAQRRRVGNISTIEGDLTQMDVIEGPLDGAFSRFFLAFLVADLDRALSCIYSSLKPGGVLSAMEYLTLESTTCSPPIRGFDAHTRAWVQYYAKNGGDTAVGRYLPAKLAAAGFKITYTNCVGGMARPGDRWWNWWGRLIEDFGEKLALGDFMSRDDLQNLRLDWANASTQQHAFIYTPVLIQLVARKE